MMLVNRNPTNDTIQVTNKTALWVYPNPANNYVTFKCNNVDIETDITVFDLYGHAIAQAIIKNGSFVTLSTQQWSDGFYIWQAVQQNKGVGQGKLEIFKQ